MSEPRKKQLEEMVANFALNLRDLTAFYPSVSEVCRKIDINRQQFNKYLAGSMMPSLHNLRRISDFFGVDESEMTLPHGEFRKIVFSRQLQERLPTEFAAMLRKQHGAVKTASDELAPYLGWYSSYIRSPTYKNKIVRDVTVIYQSGDYVFSKSLNQSKTRASTKIVSKNNGFVFWKDQRIYLIEALGKDAGDFTLCILYPSFRPSGSSMQGLLTSVGQEPNRRIYSSKLIMDFLGRKIDVRRAIGLSGIFELDDVSIDPEIRAELETGLLLA